ncbi:MAG: T9SS type A sorting domain-containing protein [Candidatus Krumholzibacteria bacterium]|nr:T9SS type A sorting domain-containing protein [Candidatus Krumholzibacteria bacterium]MDH5268303.1 T9SS type A sorting domain-containing protein [Candidatus Krumholzibacteria bacterium]
MSDPVPETRGTRRLPARPQTFAAALAVCLALTPRPAAAQSSIGIYSDVSGSSCSLSDNGQGFINGYVVVRPGQEGVSAAQFSAPPPPCFTGTYVGDQQAPGTLVLGNSQTGVSVSLLVCSATPTHVLTIQYFGYGTTPACCEYPVLPDPAEDSVKIVDCFFNETAAAGVVGRVNADGSCPCAGNSPPFPPDNPVPAHAAQGVSVLQTLGWTAVDPDDNISEYLVHFGTDPSPPLVASGLTAPSYDPGQLEEFTEYFWRVVVRDLGGFETAGLTWRFTTRAANSPPGEPRFPIPEDGTAGLPLDLSLEWSATDIDGDALTYDVYFGTEDTPPLVSSNQGVPSYTVSTLAYGTTYYWRVVARDPPGHETSGPLWSFATRPENYPPGTPANPSPANGATSQAIDVALSWHAADPDSDALVFDVYFGATNPPPLVVADLSGTAYQPGTLSFVTTYFWRVVARDEHGAVQSGPIWSFTTRPENLPPLVPASPSPPNNSTNRPLASVLGWQCSDPDGEAVTFDVYFGTGFPPPLLAAGVETNSFSPGTLAFSTQYRWRIVARDERGAETSGPTWTFATKPNSPPAAPSSPNPSNNSSNRSVLTTLSWQCSDVDGHAITYEVYFGTENPPPLVATGVETRAYVPGTLAFSTRYYWRVRARDELNATAIGALWTFTTRSDGPPTAPANPGPPHDGVAPPTATLSWTCTEPDGQPLTFDLYFGTVSSPPLVATGLTEPQFDPGPLTISTRYYWRVVASDGSLVANGPLWRFATAIPGDVNIDGAITVADAQCAFDLALLRLPACGAVSNLEYGIAAAVDCNTIATPRDARCIHKHAVDGSCSFCGTTPAAAVAPNSPPVLRQGRTYEDGDTLVVTVDLEGVASLQAFGFETWSFNATLVRVSRRGRTAGFEALGAGAARVGGYTLDGVTAMTREQFIQLRYQVPPGGAYIWIDSFVDDLAGAAPLEIYWGGGSIPVLISRFEGVETQAGIELRWELAGDETAEWFTLLRREGSSGQPVLVGEGALAGANGSYLDKSVEPATTYHYELLVRTPGGNEFRSQTVTVTTPGRELALGQNHPNPFNPTTVIPYTLPGGTSTTRVRLLVMDVSGKLVRTLVDEPQTGGVHEAIWDGRDDRAGPVSSGVYFYVLDADGKRQTRKLVLLK